MASLFHQFSRSRLYVPMGNDAFSFPLRAGSVALFSGLLTGVALTYNSESILLGLLVPDRILKGTLISTIVWVVKPAG